MLMDLMDEPLSSMMEDRGSTSGKEEKELKCKDIHGIKTGSGTRRRAAVSSAIPGGYTSCSSC